MCWNIIVGTQALCALFDKVVCRVHRRCSVINIYNIYYIYLNSGCWSKWRVTMVAKFWACRGRLLRLLHIYCNILLYFICFPSSLDNRGRRLRSSLWWYCNVDLNRFDPLYLHHHWHYRHSFHQNPHHSHHWHQPQTGSLWKGGGRQAWQSDHSEQKPDKIYTRWVISSYAS